MTRSTGLSTGHNRWTVLQLQNYINRGPRRSGTAESWKNLLWRAEAKLHGKLKRPEQIWPIYQYQRQMMLEKMDTLINNTELEKYYSENQGKLYAFFKHRALFIKIPGDAKRCENRLLPEQVNK